MCFGKINNISYKYCGSPLFKSYLSDAQAYDYDNNKSTENAELQQLASRHYRLAAVCTVLGRNHAHPYAAETYQQAAQWSRAAADTGIESMTLKLWQTAVTSMRLAGDMIAVHTDENSAKKDTLITQTIATAKQMVDNARRVSTQLASVEEWKARMEHLEMTANMCKEVLLMPTLRLLAEKQKELHAKSAMHLQDLLLCECQADWKSVKKYEQEVNSMEREISNLEKLSSFLEGQLKTAKYYRTRAAESDNVLHLHLRRLIRQSWTKAAEEMEQLALRSASFLTDGEVDDVSFSKHRAREDLYHTAQCYEYIADRVLGSVVDYLDKARGAEAGEKSGRDPREAQMWRKAASEVILEADNFFEQLNANNSFSDIYGDSRVTWDLQVSKYGMAGEYLFRAYQHRHDARMRVNPFSQRICALFEQLASMQLLRAQYPSNTEEAIMFCFMYGYRYTQALATRSNSVSMWNKALAIYLITCSYGGNELRQVDPWEAETAAMIALAADAMETGIDQNGVVK